MATIGGVKWFPGSIAWVIHRVTGVLLTLYLFAHLYILSHLKNPEEYAVLLELMKNPLVKLSEVGLLALVTIHALNGLRVTLLETGAPTKLHKPLLAAAALLAGVIIIFGAIPFFAGTH